MLYVKHLFCDNPVLYMNLGYLHIDIAIDDFITIEIYTVHSALE